MVRVLVCLSKKYLSWKLDNDIASSVICLDLYKQMYLLFFDYKK